MLFQIGERINSSRKTIASALASKDEALIRKEARIQKEAGAAMLDVNCAFNTKDESADMEWLVRIVQEETGLPLSIDSPNAQALEAGLRRHQGKALVNSVTLEKERAESVLPLVKKYNAEVIVLAMDKKGMPSTAQERLALAESAVLVSKKHGISGDNIYIDPLVRPVSSEPRQGAEAIAAVRLIKKKLGTKTICGLSNISFGLPARDTLNSVFLAMMLSSGLDAAILDPVNKKIKTSIRSAEALLGTDQFCSAYIKSFRSGELH